MWRRAFAFICLCVYGAVAWASIAEDQLEAYNRCLASSERTRELASSDRQFIERAKGATPVPVPAQYQEALVRLKKVARIPSGVEVELIGVQSNGTASVLNSGTIFLGTRLWRGQMSLDRDEAAAVIAHEIAHLELQHIRSRFCEAVAASGDDSVPLLQANQAVQQSVMATGNTKKALQIMQSNHAREMSADVRAAEMLKLAGIPPVAVKRMLLKLAGSGRSEASWSHPSLEARVEHLAEMKGHGAAY